jgi:DNA-binding LacI/PurR family transcriptional regulator
VSAETRRRIIDIANTIGWRPSVAARSLSGSRAHSVGLVLARPAETLGVEPFFMRFIAGLERELSARRIGLLLQIVEDHAAAIDAMRLCWAERRVDGMVVTDLWSDDTRIPVIEELEMPAILAGRPKHLTLLPAVWTDDAAAVFAVVDYLVALGHRSIARVSGLPVLNHTQVRIEAFRSAMFLHNLDPDDITTTDYSWEEGASATRALLSRRDRPTAIIYDNDLMAVAALNVASEMGVSVPGDVSIVAGDDSQLCELVRPALTALAWDIQAYGAHIAQALLEFIDSGKPPELLQERPANLVVRGSTGAAPPTRQ